jgi:predicted HTH domain antitoxin
MNFKLITFIIPLILLFSCQDEDAIREKERLRNAEKSEVIFEKINKGWNLNVAASTPEVASILKNWNQWNAFSKELEQKPKSSINAFRKKAIALSKKAEELNTNIPDKFDNPQVKSRISIIITQLHALDLYINLDKIPADKVVGIIPNVNKGIKSLEEQFQEILRKEKIPLEQGEADMIKMLDTTRAIPSSKPILPKN